MTTSPFELGDEPLISSVTLPDPPSIHLHHSPPRYQAFDKLPKSHAPRVRIAWPSSQGVVNPAALSELHQGLARIRPGERDSERVAAPVLEREEMRFVAVDAVPESSAHYRKAAFAADAPPAKKRGKKVKGGAV